MSLELLQNQNQKLLKNEYLIDFSRPLTNIERETLIFVYQPILGLKAIALYRFFIYQKEFQLNTKIMLKNEIFSFCNLNEKEIEELLIILKKYNLIEISEYNFKITKIDIKTPNLISDLFKNEAFYKELLKKVTTKVFEKIYLNLTQTTKNVKKILINSSDIKVKDSFIQTNFMKKMNYVPKLKEYNLYQKLITKHCISKEIIGIIVDYVLFKNSGKRVEINYLIKLIEDLDLKGILFEKNKLKIYFSKIYTNLSMNNYLIKNNIVPKWLLQESFDSKISINIKENDSKNENINNRVKNFAFKIMEDY